MERDLSLVREILLRIEEKPTRSGRMDLAIDGYPENLIIYNLDLAIQAGFVEGKVRWSADTDTIVSWTVHGLTWEGHEFLNSVRQEEVWKKTQETVEKAGHKIAHVSINVIKEVAVALVKGQMGL